MPHSPLTLMVIVHLLFVVAAAYFFLLAASNVLWLRLSSRKPRRFGGGKVSVLIPARNEENNIGRCLDSLLEQSYADYEIIVLDDQSTDGTWEIIAGYAERYPGLVRAVRGRPLPARGWHGKPHALQQLSVEAGGDYFLFTDADTVHGRDSIAWAVTNIERHGVDFLSGFVHQELRSFGETLIVPATYIISTLIMPLWLIAASRTPLLSLAIGQVVVFRRQAYEGIGGYASVSGQISDDICIARELRKAGFRTIFLDIRRYVSCRLYAGYREAFAGLTKNVSDFLNRKVASLVAGTLAVVFLILLPYVLLVPYLASADHLSRPVVLAVLLFQLAWCCVLYDRGLRWWVPFLYPVVYVLALVMMWRGYGKLTWGAGLVWKGRVVK